MNPKLKAFGMAALAALAAGTTTQAATTNILQNVSVQLTVYTQGGSSTSSSGTVTTTIVVGALDTKGLIAALSTDASITKTPFSSKAFLAIESAVVSPATGGPADVTTGSSGLVVVDGNNIVSVPDTVINVTKANKFSASAVTKNGTTTSAASVAVDTLAVDIPGAWNFTAIGLGTDAQQGIPVGKAGTIDIRDTSLNVAGYGLQGASTSVIVDGKITTSYLKTLIQ
jgi:hypothetical protein